MRASSTAERMQIPPTPTTYGCDLTTRKAAPARARHHPTARGRADTRARPHACGPSQSRRRRARERWTGGRWQSNGGAGWRRRRRRPGAVAFGGGGEGLAALRADQGAIRTGRGCSLWGSVSRAEILLPRGIQGRGFWSRVQILRCRIV